MFSSGVPHVSLSKALPVLTAALQGASNKVVVFFVGIFFFRYTSLKMAKVKYTKRIQILFVKHPLT